MHETIRKAYDTLLILCDLRGVRIGETRVDSDLILVVSGEKIRARSGKRSDDRAEISRSDSFSRFGKTIAKIADDHFIEGGMGALKGYCFNDVFVYTEEESQKSLVKYRDSSS